MLDFETYVARHGEYGVQAIIERLERYEGIRATMPMALEDRWAALMQDSGASSFGSQQRMAA